MSYCTAQDLTDRFGEQELIQLTDRTNTSTIDTAVLNQAISDATAEINGYLLAYLPLATLPANLVRLACDIARYYLYDDLVSVQVEKRYSQAIDYLKLVAAGKIPLASDALGSAAPAATETVDFTAVAGQFSNLPY
jgi:phage gp36-like protein